jgi:CO/xanthine dehydrogenase Mo-binding subunit
MDELARKLKMDPIEFRHRNVIRPGDPMTSLAFESDDLDYGSYGLDQCHVHGFHIAVHRVTGEIKILQSVQAVDAGVVINPLGCNWRFDKSRGGPNPAKSWGNSLLVCECRNRA